MATTIHSLVYKISSSADLKGLVATRSEVSAAKRLMQETRTVNERFSGSIEALNALHRKGAIDAETHRRAVAKLNSELSGGAGGVGKDLSGTGSMLAGQVPGVSAFSSALSTIGPIGAATVVGLGAINLAADLLVGTFSAVTGAVGEAMQRIDETTDAAAKIGITGDSLEGLRLAAQRAGVDAGTFDNALTKLNKNLGEAATEGGEAAEKFSDIGLDVGKLASMKPDAAFKDIAAALGEIESPYERARVAQELFGKSGQELIPVFMEGADAIRQAEIDAEAFGSTIGEAGRRDIAEANDRLEDLGEIVEGAANALAVELAPAISEVAGEAVQLVKDFGGVRTAVADMVHFAKADIAVLVDSIKLMQPELGIVGKGINALFGGDGERSRTQDLDAKVREQQERNRQFAQPEADAGPLVTDADIAEGQKLINEAEKARKDKQRLEENLAEKQIREEERAAQEAAREQERIRNEAQRFTEGLLNKQKSPKERLQEGLADIQKAVGLGVIGQSEAALAESQLARDIVGADAVEKEEAAQRQPSRTAGAANLRGTAEAFSAILKGADRANGEPVKKTEKNTEKTYKAAEELLNETKRANAQPKQPIQVLTF